MSRVARRPLPDAELDVLAVLRHAGEATATDIGRALDVRRPMAHGSVVTLLSRLEGKGMVTRRKGPVGKAFVYRPTTRAHRTLRQVAAGLVERVFGRDRLVFVASLLESAPPSEGELDRLESLLAELRARRGRFDSGARRSSR